MFREGHWYLKDFSLNELLFMGIFPENAKYIEYNTVKMGVKV